MFLTHINYVVSISTSFLKKLQIHLIFEQSLKNHDVHFKHMVDI